jgi:hypothetical protein
MLAKTTGRWPGGLPGVGALSCLAGALVITVNRGLLAGLLGISLGACFGTDGGISECGNAIVENEEVCDDGVNDGSYGGCEYDCLAPGPYCGDGEIRGTDELYRSCGSCWARSYRVSFECDEDFCDCYAVPTAAGGGCDEACNSETT